MNELSRPDTRFAATNGHFDFVSKLLHVKGRGRAWIARAVFILTFALLFVSAGCEVVVFEQTEFQDALVDADGQTILLDDVAAIVNDPDLDDTEKRGALRELGIEDEDLIDVLLGA